MSSTAARGIIRTILSERNFQYVSTAIKVFRMADPVIPLLTKSLSCSKSQSAEEAHHSFPSNSENKPKKEREYSL